MDRMVSGDQVNSEMPALMRSGWVTPTFCPIRKETLWFLSARGRTTAEQEQRNGNLASRDPASYDKLVNRLQKRIVSVLMFRERESAFGIAWKTQRNHYACISAAVHSELHGAMLRSGWVKHKLKHTKVDGWMDHWLLTSQGCTIAEQKAEQQNPLPEKRPKRPRNR